MTRRTALPTRDEIRIAISHLAEATGNPPTVLALARHLGLATGQAETVLPGGATRRAL